MNGNEATVSQRLRHVYTTCRESWPTTSVTFQSFVALTKIKLNQEKHWKDFKHLLSLELSSGCGGGGATRRGIRPGAPPSCSVQRLQLETKTLRPAPTGTTSRREKSGRRFRDGTAAGSWHWAALHPDWNVNWEYWDLVNRAASWQLPARLRFHQRNKVTNKNPLLINVCQTLLLLMSTAEREDFFISLFLF